MQLLRRSDASCGYLQTDLAALRKQNVHCLLSVLRKQSLHFLNVFVCLGLNFGRCIIGSTFQYFVCQFVGLDLDFRVGQIPSPAFAVTKTVRRAPSLTIGGRGLEERVLLLVSIGGDELIGVNLGLLHSVAACCWC